MPTEQISFCRICSGGCGMRLTVDDDGRILSIRGDQDNPMTKGYACFKGLQAEQAHHGSERLLHPLQRDRNGNFIRIPLERALDEIAERISEITARDGSDALAAFCGNGALLNALALPMISDFLRAMGSRNYFSTMTIDQSSKLVAFGRLGGWAAGLPNFETSDVALLFGANPLVSHALLGSLAPDPVRRLKVARANGLKLIVIDPRRTETARNCDLFLQPYPGQDIAIAAGLIRLILNEGWHDRAFCDRWVSAAGMANLGDAVAPFTEEAVETRAGLQPGQIRQVAELFARDSRLGAAQSATGPSMSPYSVLAEQLIQTLNVVCGRYLRAGDPVYAVNAMDPPLETREGVIPAMRFWQADGLSRIRGVHNLAGDRLTATLSDEILTPGEGQIRALINDGGDPMTSFPDRLRTERALKSLELLVTIEPWMTRSAAFSHYILPPLMQYERADLPLKISGVKIWPGAWTQYTAPVIAPPPGSDLVNDWYVFWAIASRLGRTIEFDGTGPLDMEDAPGDDALIARRLQGSYASLEELRRFPHGHDFPIQQPIVLAAAQDNDATFDLMPVDVAEELEDFWENGDRPGALVRDGKRFSHLLSTRRMRDVLCSNGRFVETVQRRTPVNPAFLNPADLGALGLATGDLVDIASAHGRIRAIVDSDPNVRPGVVSIAHGWGGEPGALGDPMLEGAGVNDLIDTVKRVEPINAMPHMTALPVNITPVAA